MSADIGDLNLDSFTLVPTISTLSEQPCSSTSMDVIEPKKSTDQFTAIEYDTIRYDFPVVAKISEKVGTNCVLFTLQNTHIVSFIQQVFSLPAVHETSLCDDTRTKR